MPPDNGVKLRGAYSPPDRLRLRIVEMAAGKRSRFGTGKPAELNATHETYTKLDGLSKTFGGDSGKAREPCDATEREVTVYQSPEISIKVREKIDLDLPSNAQCPRQQQSRHDMYRPTHDVPFTGTAVGAKERASAYLLKRFKQRNAGVGDILPSRQELSSFKVPSNYPSSGAEPTKRVRVTSGSHAPKYADATLVTRRPYQENVSQAQTTHLPFADADAIRRKSKSAKRDHSNEANLDQDSNGFGVGKEQQIHTVKFSELKGSALETPPPRQNSASRKNGMFSASLEAFKRRLRQSASKYNSRLHNDEVDKTEEYVVLPEPADKYTGMVPHPPEGKPPAHPRPLSEIRRRPAPKPAHVYRLNSGNQSGKEEVAVDGNNCSGDNSRKNSAEPREIKSGHRTGKPDRLSRREYPANEVSALNRPLAARNPYRTLEVADHDQEKSTLSFADTSKQPLPNVKTYVVMSEKEDKSHVNPPRAAPLTEHNLRLHDSLQVMLERRARRMARFQRRQIQAAAEKHQWSNDGGHQRQHTEDAAGHESDDSLNDSMTSNRIKRWVAEATEQSVLRRVDSSAVGNTEIILQSLTPRSVAEETIIHTQMTPRSRVEHAVESAIQFEQSIMHPTRVGLYG